MENNVATFDDIKGLKSFVLTEIEKSEQRLEQKFEQKLEQAVANMIKWVVGLFIASLLVTTSIVGIYTGLIALATDLLK